MHYHRANDVSLNCRAQGNHQVTLQAIRGGKSIGTWKPKSQKFSEEKVFAASFAEKI